jgi:small subunit ribosomal protein S1
MTFSMDDFAKALEQHTYDFSKGQIVRGRPASYDNDGVYVDIGGKAAAFLPASEVGLKQVADLSQALPLNEEREFMIIQEQNADGQVTLSVRAMEIRDLWEQLAEMQDTEATLQVRVSGVNKGGITVDAEGLRGFVPRSHLVDRSNPDSLVGRAITVCVLEANAQTRKLVLSQRLASQAASFSRLSIGQLIEGTVSGIRPFGVFVDFDGTSGLLHINQISKNYVSSPDAVFKAGQPIKAVIQDIDEIKRRISLSTKVLESYPGEVLENLDGLMADAEARMQKIREAEAAAAQPEDSEEAIAPETEAERSPEPSAVDTPSDTSES